MMPKLPPPYGVLHGVQVWHGDDLLAYGHAVAEAKDAEIAELRAERERDDVAFELLVKEASLLRAERDALQSRLDEVREIYAGMDGFIPQTAPEGYLLRIVKQMYDAAMAEKRGT